MLNKYLLPAILTFSLTTSILLSVFWLSAFDVAWYHGQFDRLGVYQSLPQERAWEQTDNLFDYLNGVDVLNYAFYTARETNHLQDIKNLLWGVKITSIVSVLLLIGCSYWLRMKLEKKKVNAIFFWPSGLAVFIYLISAAILSLFFDQMFLLLHRLLFVNDFWQLDPAMEKLVVIFSPALFAALGLKIIVISTVVSLLIFFSSGYYLWRTKNS